MLATYVRDVGAIGWEFHQPTAFFHPGRFSLFYEYALGISWMIDIRQTHRIQAGKYNSSVIFHSIQMQKTLSLESCNRSVKYADDFFKSKLKAGLEGTFEFCGCWSL